MKARRIIGAFLCFTLLFMLYPAAAPAEVVIPAPVLYMPEDGRITNANKPVYWGVSLGNVTIEIKVDGVTETTATADQSGNWNCIQPTPLADGSHTVVAVASDGAGHTSAPSNTNTFTVDTTPPSATLINSPVSGSSTNSSTPSVSGTAEANCTVHVYFNGTDAGTVAADASGNWLFHHTAALEDGTYMILTMAFDAAGNYSYGANTCMLSVDATPPAAPVVSAPANASATNNNRPAYTGTAEAGSTVTVITDGSTIGTTTADAAGNWSFTQPTALTEGYHTIRAAAADAVGNVSPGSNVNSFTVDTTSPAAPVAVSPANGSSTNDNTPAISGTAEANSTVTVLLDGAVQGTAAANGAGNWSFTQPVPLGDGAHAVKARARDAAGNVSVDSNTNVFIVDTVPPAAPSVNTPAHGDVINDSTPTYSGTADPGSTVHIFADGSETGTIAVNGAGNWSYTPASPLYDGYHTVKASAADWLGNTSAYSNPNAFTVDTVPPDAPVITTPLSGSISHVSKPILSGTAEPGSTLTVYIDGAPFTIHADGTGKWQTESSGLADGNHTISALASDAAGNTSPGSGANSFMVDTSVLPAIIVTAPANGSVTSSMAPDFSGTTEPRFSVDVFVDGALLITVTADAAGAWSLNAPLVLADGPHTVYAVISASSKTIQSTMNTFMVDKTPPAAPLVITPAYGSSVTTGTPSISGAAEAYSTVTIMLDGAIAGTGTADGAGNWSFTPSSALAAGDHTVKASAQDAAGNAGPYSNDSVFSVNLPVTITAITGVTAPVKGAAPISQITETNEYTGTVTWSPSGSRFRPDTVYTATITLSAKTGYSFSFTNADFFKVQGASASNDAGSGVITAVFPATAPFENAEVSPVSCLYDLSGPTDAAAQITFHDAVSVTDVLLDAAPFPAPADYAVNGNALTIKAGFLSGLNLVMGDVLHFIIVFDAGAECALNVTVTDSAALRDATLAELRVDGALVAGFSLDTAAYTVELPYGTLPGSAAATVTAAPSRANAKVSIAQAASLPGDAVVTVTAMDETAVRAYTVHLKLAPPVYYDVSFIDREETHAVRTVLAGTSIGAALWPLNPRRNGYTFRGWYTGKNGSGSAFSVSTAVNGPMNVRAKWTSILSDIDREGGTLQPQVLLNGSATGLATMTPNPDGTGGQILTISPENMGKCLQTGFMLSVTLPLMVPPNTIPLPSFIEQSLSGHFVPETQSPSTFSSCGSLTFPGSLISTSGSLGTLVCNTDMGSVTLPSNLLGSGMMPGTATGGGAVLTFMSGSTLSSGTAGGTAEVPVFYVGLTMYGQQISQADPGMDMEMMFHCVFSGHTPNDPVDYTVFHMDENGGQSLIPGCQFNPETRTITFDTSDFGYFMVMPQP